jgi:hypothetical protein
MANATELIATCLTGTPNHWLKGVEIMLHTAFRSGAFAEDFRNLYEAHKREEQFRARSLEDAPINRIGENLFRLILLVVWHRSQPTILSKARKVGQLAMDAVSSREGKENLKKALSSCNTLVKSGFLNIFFRDQDWDLDKLAEDRVGPLLDSDPSLEMHKIKDAMTTKFCLPNGEEEEISAEGRGLYGINNKEPQMVEASTLIENYDRRTGMWWQSEPARRAIQNRKLGSCSHCSSSLILEPVSPRSPSVSSSRSFVQQTERTKPMSESEAKAISQANRFAAFRSKHPLVPKPELTPKQKAEIQRKDQIIKFANGAARTVKTQLSGVGRCFEYANSASNL